MRPRRLAAAVVAVLAGLSPVYARDGAAAREYLKKAQASIAQREYEDASDKLELAENELDDATAPDKAELTAAITKARAAIASGSATKDAPRYRDKLAGALRQAEDSVGNAGNWDSAEERLKDLFADPAAKAALGDELAAGEKKFNTLKRLQMKKVAAGNAASVEASVKELETAWKEAKPKIVANGDDKDGAVRDVESALESAREMLKRLDGTDLAAPFIARIDAVGAPFVQLALADEAKEKAARLTESWNDYKDEYAGWEAETTPLTFAQFMIGNDKKNDALGAPQTVGLISRATSFLESVESDDDYKAVASDPAVKKIHDKIAADRAAALAKMEKFVASVVAEAEKQQPLDERARRAILTLDDGLKNNLEGSSKLPELQERTAALLKGIKDSDTAMDAAEVAKRAEADKYRDAQAEKAAAAWPAMKAAYKTEEGFDPNHPADFKGKLILIETDNLMGNRFNPGDFPFATTVDGTPIAAKYDPAIAKAIKEVESHLNHNLGDNDNDGKWEIIARVTGTTGKLSKRIDISGEVKDRAGNSATVTGERAETVDAPIIVIVAAHCGPLAAKAE